MGKDLEREKWEPEIREGKGSWSSPTAENKAEMFRKGFIYRIKFLPVSGAERAG